jgi:hypothetical protein
MKLAERIARSALAFVALALAATGPMAAWAGSEALIGAWKLNPAKSRVDPGPVPYKSMTLKFSATERGLRNDAQGIDADGKPFQAGYEIVTDGSDHRVTGVREYDSSSYTPVSDTTTVYIRKKRGTTVVAGSRVLSRDGKTLTFREKRVNDEGRETGTATLVFDRL